MIHDLKQSNTADIKSLNFIFKKFVITGLKYKISMLDS